MACINMQSLQAKAVYNHFFHAVTALSVLDYVSCFSYVETTVFVNASFQV